MYARIFLSTLLYVGSVFVWCRLAVRWRRREPFLKLNDETRANWSSAGELTGVYVAILWAVIHLAHTKTAASVQPRTIDTNSVAIDAAVKLCLSLVLPFLMVSRQRPWSAIGMSTLNLSNQISVGIGGFFAAVLPMAISMAASTPFRGLENRHSLLNLLVESPNFATIALVAMAAVISAPLVEELLFRVILQGSLTTVFPPSIAIGIVAILFALVHGWRDGIALLPLAIILGYVFHRRHSYVAVVVIHALFNATMLTLQLLTPPTTLIPRTT